jgi:hypothetical protein
MLSETHAIRHARPTRLSESSAWSRYRLPSGRGRGHACGRRRDGRHGWHGLLSQPFRAGSNKKGPAAMPGLLLWSQQLELFPARWNPVTPAIDLANAGRDESRCYRDLLGTVCPIGAATPGEQHEQTRARRTPPRQERRNQQQTRRHTRSHAA